MEKTKEAKTNTRVHAGLHVHTALLPLPAAAIHRPAMTSAHSGCCRAEGAAFRRLLLSLGLSYGGVGVRAHPVWCPQLPRACCARGGSVCSFGIEEAKMSVSRIRSAVLLQG